MTMQVSCQTIIVKFFMYCTILKTIILFLFYSYSCYVRAETCRLGENDAGIQNKEYQISH